MDLRSRGGASSALETRSNFVQQEKTPKERDLLEDLSMITTPKSRISKTATSYNHSVSAIKKPKLTKPYPQQNFNRT